MAQWPSSAGVIQYHPPTPQLGGSCVGPGECILHGPSRGECGVECVQMCVLNSKGEMIGVLVTQTFPRGRTALEAEMIVIGAYTSVDGVSLTQ